jgi:hypothetical protein
MRSVQRIVGHRRLNHLNTFKRVYTNEEISEKSGVEKNFKLSGWFIEDSIVYRLNVHEGLIKEGGGEKKGCFLETDRVDFMMEVQRRGEVKD